ncbi:hypothetical protein PR202_gb25042 [Eleusine coracana subsp. coracana]|uniref:NB-ARC domain-containing protein n=1 Tax=Eleusine coracana subsp. coracana TaxID=191504 RepID=A0AAV5FN66_ELECO|nr:hypothetical protein PR202_gb25042 [Eleusine coracana subsp. coracana]
MKLKDHLEQAEEQGANQICLDNVHYAQILLEVFPKTRNNEPMHNQQQGIKEGTKSITGTTTLDDGDQIKDPDSQDQICKEAVIDESTWKINRLQMIIKSKMMIKGIIEKIQSYLEHEQAMFVLRIDQIGWEETIDALRLLDCVAGAVIVTTSKKTQQVKEYFSLQQEPMDYSRVGLYHDIVLEITSQQKMEESSYDSHIFRAILDKCEPYELCMNIFAHALYANPKRSNAVLHNLYCTLQASPRSLGSIAKKILQFSYSNLPEEYKSCLLSLAIYPHGHCIRRSTLIGRWIVEGLITKEDWPSSVDQANKCFDALIDQWFIYPAHVGVTEQVKTCVVGELVHGFITKIATKKGILETGLPHHLACHFSIFSNVRLKSYARIGTFFHALANTPGESLLKVLDLEGSGISYRHHVIKDICNKMLLLKYLSLRGICIDQLPSEINNLQELEVLDIRDTHLPPYATRHVRLLKLKRLLAGPTDPSPSNTGPYTDNGVEVKSVQIPEMIGKMLYMEVLSNVKGSSQDLKTLESCGI